MKSIAVVASALLAGAWITGSNAEPLGAPVASAASDWLVLADLSTQGADAQFSYAISRPEDAAQPLWIAARPTVPPGVGRRGIFEEFAPLPIFVRLSGPVPGRLPETTAFAGVDRSLKFATATLERRAAR